VEFSVERGFYDEPFNLELKTATPEAIIRYTMDGSQPSEEDGLLYTEPIMINRTTLLRASAFKPNFLPGYLDTHTYIFLDNVLAQPADPPGFPTKWGTHNKNISEYKKDFPVIADYQMDPDIVNDPRYREVIKEALKSLPSLSIVTDFQNLSLYANPRERGYQWERPASLELIDPDDDQAGFQVNAGVRIQGNTGRNEEYPKHSFRLFFRNEWGPTKLNHPLFADSPVEKFDTLILRSGVNRSYAGDLRSLNEIKLTTYTRDEWLRASQVEVSGLGSHGIFVHLYLNGLYWGLYNLVERPDAAFTAAYLGGQKEDWFAIKHGNLLIGPSNNTWTGSSPISDTIQGEPSDASNDIRAELISGSSDRFLMLHQLARQGGLADPGKYAVIKEYLDTTDFIDYLILNWYAGNEDWPDANWYAGVQNPDGQVRYFVWDGEMTWLTGANISLDKKGAVGWPNNIKPLFLALIQNPDFKVELADRMYKHLFNAGTLTDARAQARWLSLNAEIEQAIIGEVARWGDARFEPPLTQEDWFKARDDVLAQMSGNSTRLITLARDAGYYPALDPPIFNQRDGSVTAGFKLTMTAPTARGGDIYYTTDGSDPRLLVTGAVAPTAKLYRTPVVVLTEATHIKARTQAGEQWSALQETVFQTVEGVRQLHLTEIMYNPIGGDDYEFIELTNNGVNEIDLSGLSFTGLVFTFSPNSPPLSSGASLVLVRNPLTFAERYPGVKIGGVYDGQLSNKGEQIVLRDIEDKVLVSVEYNDENAWPISPDGRGDSLVLINWAGNPSDPKNWRASTDLNGSPGN
jgi:hypothetical protein